MLIQKDIEQGRSKSDLKKSFSDSFGTAGHTDRGKGDKVCYFVSWQASGVAFQQHGHGETC